MEAYITYTGKEKPMRKRIFIILLAVMLVLCGCDREETAEPTQSSEPIAATEPTLFPVEEDVFYFSNELEYNRLYSQRTDGNDLKLVSDEICYQVQQSGDTVYYLNDSNLCTYHIPTAQRRVYIEDVMDYQIDGDDLVYFRFSDTETYQQEMYYRNIATGEDSYVTTFVLSNYVLHDGLVYFSGHSLETGTVHFSVFDVRSGEVKLISDQLMSCYYLTPVDDGVIFKSLDWNYDSTWYFASADGSEIEQINSVFSEYCDVLHVSNGSYLCLYQYYDGKSIELIHRHNPDGTITDLYEAKEGAYLYVEYLGNERWLIDQCVYQNWGPMNEYGYQEGLAVQSEYLLMDAEGNITPLRAVGELGKMFASGDFPVIDSSTARKPVTEAIYNLFVKNYNFAGVEPLCSTTHGAWLNIADRSVDLALLAAPTEEELAYLKERGVEIEMKLYGGDGLVFIGNAANPVTSLTHEQILGIYRGEITNWREVGGPDHPITVYYRDDQSGSQRLFEKLVFKGQEIPDYERLNFAIMDDMSSIVDIILEDPYSIGYSIMTYLDEVYAEENLQVFAVNGVKPSPDTVRDSSYKYHTQGYVVIRADEPADSPARRLYDWFGSKVCNELLTYNSVTPLQDGVG